MDFWASLEHKLKYKSNAVIEDDLRNDLSKSADTIAEIDENMFLMLGENANMQDSHDMWYIIRDAKIEDFVDLCIEEEAAIENYFNLYTKI